MKAAIFASAIVSMISVTISTHNAHALTVDIFSAANESSGIESWFISQGGTNYTLQNLENFDTETPGWYNNYTTYVDGTSEKFGTFTATGEYGTGASSYRGQENSNSTDSFFRILSADDYWGRGDLSADGNGQYLDSADVSEVELQLDVKLTNLYFYMTDPSDVGAKTTVSSDLFSNSYSSGSNDYLNSGQANGGLFFVGISLSDEEIAANDFIGSVLWSTNNDQNDGWGVDSFGTVAPVPEPATMFLFGTGLAGLAAGYRRKLKNNRR